jgi:NitT/TauT family transport system substrate-binding protein
MTMTRYRLSRRAALGLIGATGGSVLVELPGRRASAQVLDKVSYQTSWRPRPSMAGFARRSPPALQEDGIDCDPRMGGPHSLSQLLMAGVSTWRLSSGLDPELR